jgi:hypothetical protein
MTDSQLVRLLQLRLIVGFLGEKPCYNWWPTSFAAPSARAFLEPAFPRTTGTAIFHGVSTAAARVHDEFIGIGLRVFHLFRLPAETEQDLHEAAQAVYSDLNVRGVFKSRDAGLDVLAAFAESVDSGHEGPVAIGEIEDLWKCRLIDTIAGKYFSAFRGSMRSYPYLTTKH